MFKKIFVFLILLILTGCSQEEPSLIMSIGDSIEEIDTELIYTHEEAVSFPAVVRSSGQKPVETEYKGLELKMLFEKLSIDTRNYSKVTFNASDGYRIILSLEEINEPSNVYLAFERDGERLK